MNHWMDATKYFLDPSIEKIKEEEEGIKMKDLIEEMKELGWEPNQCQHSDGYEYQTFRRPLPKDKGLESYLANYSPLSDIYQVFQEIQNRLTKLETEK